MLTSDISCKKIKLNILNLNSEIESLFDSKEEKINATYSKWVHINCILFKINFFKKRLKNNVFLLIFFEKKTTKRQKRDLLHEISSDQSD